jgi:hypothetical protein
MEAEMVMATARAMVLGTALDLTVMGTLTAPVSATAPMGPETDQEMAVEMGLEMAPEMAMGSAMATARKHNRA